jgi:hypothetical protein
MDSGSAPSGASRNDGGEFVQLKCRRPKNLNPSQRSLPSLLYRRRSHVGLPDSESPNCVFPLTMGTIDDAFNAPPAEYSECRPNAYPCRRAQRIDAPACSTAGVCRATRRAAIRFLAGSAGTRTHRRSSGTHCGACSRRNPCRRCIHNCRCALPLNLAGGPCRSIRSSAEAVAPWLSLVMGSEVRADAE